jgi:hypothetical protein
MLTNILKENGRPYMRSREIWVMEVRRDQSEPGIGKQSGSDRPTGRVNLENNNSRTRSLKG